MIKIGEAAPQFKGEAYVSGEFKNISLTDYKGKWVVLFFYPLDFTFVCPTELRAFAQQEKDFKDAGAVVVGRLPVPEPSRIAVTVIAIWLGDVEPAAP